MTVWLTADFIRPLNTDMKNVRVAFTYARMNPPTEGHRRVVESLIEEAKRTGATARVYLSETHDSKRNPLQSQQKLDLVRRAFPEIEVRLARTLFAAGCDLAADGGDDAVMVVGADRASEFSKRLTAYVGTPDLPLKSIEIRAITRDEDDVSATQARDAAVAGDWKTFQSLSPSNVAQELYVAVRNGMGATDAV